MMHVKCLFFNETFPVIYVCVVKILVNMVVFILDLYVWLYGYNISNRVIVFVSDCMCMCDYNNVISSNYFIV